MRYCLALLLTQFLHGLGHAAEPLRFGTFDVPQSPTLAVCEQVLREAYAQLGRTFTLEYLPSLRSIYWAKSGRLDGELCRAVPSPPLLMVQTPIAHWQLTAFSREPLPVTRREDLETYKVSYLHSMVIVPALITGLDLIPFRSMKAGLKQLSANRVDIVLTDQNTLLQAAQQLGMPAPIANQPPVFQGSLYHLLNEQHAELAEQLELQLQTMNRNGRLEQIEQDVLARAMQAAPIPASQTNSR